jgi:fructosamine-3-kinase
MIKSIAQKYLSERFSSKVEIKSTESLSGGCINHALKLITSAGNFFVKWNSDSAYPGMFESEAKGLNILSQSNTLRIPEVISTGEENNTSFILLEFIEAGRPGKNFFRDFGTKLALMHKNTSSFFGLDHDNYIGSLLQKNIQEADGKKFFIEHRLKFQFDLACRSGSFSTQWSEKFEPFCEAINELLPEEPPALLHGDLWNGNYLIGDNGACLIDPAVYFGYRETDIAMTKLFGGFDREFYSAYHETFPLQPGYEGRFEIFNMYPLLVHVNLFGGGYVEQVKRIIEKYI